MLLGRGLLEGEEEVDEGGAFVEVEFFAEAVAGAFHTTHAELGELGDVFGGEVEAQQSAESQVAGCERRIPLLQIFEEILVNEVEIVLIQFPEVVAVGICAQLGEHRLHIALADAALSVLFAQRSLDALNRLVARHGIECHRSHLLGLIVELGFQELLFLLGDNLFLLKHFNVLLEFFIP